MSKTRRGLSFVLCLVMVFSLFAGIPFGVLDLGTEANAVDSNTNPVEDPNAESSKWVTAWHTSMLYLDQESDVKTEVGVLAEYNERTFRTVIPMTIMGNKIRLTYSNEYSQMLRQQLAKGNNGLTKTKFITFGVEGESMAQVKPRLDHIQNDLLNNFHRLGVQAKPLNGVQRLKLMHDMFNMDGASKFHFDWKDLVKSGLSVRVMPLT